MKAYCKIHRGTTNNLRISALFDELRKKKKKLKEKNFSLNGISRECSEIQVATRR
jgi:hypothetical protein